MFTAGGRPRVVAWLLLLIAALFLALLSSMQALAECQGVSGEGAATRGAKLAPAPGSPRRRANAAAAAAAVAAAAPALAPLEPVAAVTPAPSPAATAPSTGAAAASGSAEDALDAMLARARAEIASRLVLARLSNHSELLARGVMNVGALQPYLRIVRKALDITAARAAAGLADQAIGDFVAGDPAVDPPEDMISLLLIGGSTAAGAELGDARWGFAATFADWLQIVLRVPVGLLNMAVGATASEYYALCGCAAAAAASPARGAALQRLSRRPPPPAATAPTLAAARTCARAST